MRLGAAIMADGSRSSLTVIFPATHGNMTSIQRTLQSYPHYPVSFTAYGDTRRVTVKGHPEMVWSFFRMLASEGIIGASVLCSIDAKITVSSVRPKRRGGTGSTNSTSQSGVV